MPEVGASTRDEIEHRWTALRQRNPSYYDGRLYHVLGVHRNGHGGAALHVIDCAYRYFAVQDDSFDLGVRALGVKGLVARGDHYLFGHRSNAVGSYGDMWEFAPSGSVEPPKSPNEIIQQELVEETGLTPAREPIHRAMMFDPVLRCWEIVLDVAVERGEPQPRSHEYTELVWRPIGELPSPLSPIARQIADYLRTSSLGLP